MLNRNQAVFVGAVHYLQSACCSFANDFYKHTFSTASIELAEHDLTLRQWEALRELHEHPDCSLHQLAQATYSTDEAFGTLAARMIEQGLIGRLFPLRHGRRLYREVAKSRKGGGCKSGRREGAGKRQGRAPMPALAATTALPPGSFPSAVDIDTRLGILAEGP